MLCQDVLRGDTVVVVSHIQYPIVFDRVRVCVFSIRVHAFMQVVQTPLCHDKLCVQKEPAPSPITTTAPSIPHTPNSSPVLMSPGQANSFNHLLMPSTGQAD